MPQHLSIRVVADNPTHHLWDNNGTWFVHYTVHPDRLTAERVRRSLGTKSLQTALRRRDALLGTVTRSMVAPRRREGGRHELHPLSGPRPHARRRVDVKSRETNKPAIRTPSPSPPSDGGNPDAVQNKGTQE